MKIPVQPQIQTHNIQKYKCKWTRAQNHFQTCILRSTSSMLTEAKSAEMRIPALFTKTSRPATFQAKYQTNDDFIEISRSEKCFQISLISYERRPPRRETVSAIAWMHAWKSGFIPLENHIWMSWIKHYWMQKNVRWSKVKSNEETLPEAKRTQELTLWLRLNGSIWIFLQLQI